MNPNLTKLQPYPFEKLKALFGQSKGNEQYNPIALSIGEPKHPAPSFVLSSLRDNLAKIENYPSTNGLPELRESIAHWLNDRFNLNSCTVNPASHVLPVNGTREALFSFTQAVIDAQNDAVVLSPNPFYQIYEGAAFLAGAQPIFLNCTAENNFIPDYDAIDEKTWQRTQLLFLCSPGNPTGAVTPLNTLCKLIELSDRYHFVIASDECYSEIYINEERAPVGLLEACEHLGRKDFKNCVVFHSLSKRSNLPGLRSGFVAGDESLLRQYLKYRTYHGCAMPLHNQLASIAAWSDEQHVQANRSAYREKFSSVLDILKPHLDVEQTDASFYLWPQTPIDDELFAKALYEEKNVIVLPGRYLSRDIDGTNPGHNRIRMALVAPIDECTEAARRIADFIQTL